MNLPCLVKQLFNDIRTIIFAGRHWVKAGIAVVIVATAATRASAGWVTATFSDVNPGQVVTIHSASMGLNETGWAGVYNFKNASGDLTGDLRTFCIDIAQGIYTNTTATFELKNLSSAPTPGTAMGQDKANLISELWGRDFASITTNSQAAAFQIAIWEIINEKSGNALNVKNGDFTVTGVGGATLNLANTWLSELNGSGPFAPNLIAMTSSTYQDYVVQGTPAPASLALAVAGVIGMLPVLAWRRRKLNQAVASSC